MLPQWIHEDGLWLVPGRQAFFSRIPVAIDQNSYELWADATKEELFRLEQEAIRVLGDHVRYEIEVRWSSRINPAAAPAYRCPNDPWNHTKHWLFVGYNEVDFEDGESVARVIRHLNKEFRFGTIAQFLNDRKEALRL